MKVRLQASIRGFTGKAAMVYAMYDTESDTCIIGKVGGASAKKEDGSVMISDAESREYVVDDYYLESDIAPSMTDFHNLYNAGRVIISSKVRVADPTSHIEFEGLNAGKKEYRVMPTISNAQVAVMAIARYILKAKKIEQVIKFSDDFNALLNGEAITV